MNIIISSIENGSGKTMIAAGLAAVMQSLGYKTGIYKPIQTGAIDKGKYLLSPDLNFVKMVDEYIKTHSTYMLKTNAIPLVGSIAEYKNINIENIQNDYLKLSQKTDILLVESTDGLMTPIQNKIFSYNIALKLNLPILFVITPTTSISAYLNELNTAKLLKLDILGVVINKFPVYSDNIAIKSFPEIIEKYSDVKILGLIRKFKGKSISTNTLINEILNGIDLEDLFEMKISKLSGI